MEGTYIKMDDLHKGEIYMVKHRETGKTYIGQARKYVSENNNKWGTNGRWKSHIREAMSVTVKDHCRLLNQAIREFGKDSFDVTKLCDCELEKMDELESSYIKQYDTLAPNGYNLTTGGGKNRHVQIDPKLKDGSIKKVLKAETKQRISKGQLGNRREPKDRKFAEDADLPKYITSFRENDKIIGYKVCGYPIGVTEKKYLSKTFQDSSNPQNALEAAKQFLLTLEEKYKHVPEHIHDIKIQQEKKDIAQKLVQKHKEKLPEFIHPIISNTKLAGYYVEGLKNSEGSSIPRKDFIGNTNRWNYDKALRYIDQINMLIGNGVKVEDWSKVDTLYKRTKKGVDEEVLPKYINVKYYKDQKCGYNVNGYPIKQENGSIKKTNICFTNSKYTMEQKYKMALECLENLKRDHPILN